VFIPIRAFIILGILHKFKRGYTYYQRVYDNNSAVAGIEICRFLDNKDFDV